MATQMDPMTPILYKIEKFRRELHDTFSINLLPANGHSIGRFTPGQFNMLYVFGVGEAPISISGDPYKPDTLTHTVRVVGSVTRAMSVLKPGETMGVRGPYGNHWPVEEAFGDDIVIIAGGIGLAPLRPVIYQVLARRERFGRVVILYGSRTPEDILYRKEIGEWRKHLDLEVQVTTDRATGGWRGNVGVVTRLIPRAHFDPYQCTVFVCGPEIMMRFTVRELEEIGVDLDSIYVSLERNMKCAVGYCGHCQYRQHFICKDGPVFNYNEIKDVFEEREI
ncbi:MAG: FAD/NAD(P)-binding protein [Calditrichia bacterium]